MISGVKTIAAPMPFDIYSVMREIKQGKIELCFYYSTIDGLIKHGYMYNTLSTLKPKYDISFANWVGFKVEDIVVDGAKSNLDLLCVKAKKWCSDMNDKNAVDTILDFMEDAQWYEAKDRESTLSHVVSCGIKKSIYVISLVSES